MARPSRAHSARPPARRRVPTRSRSHRLRRGLAVATRIALYGTVLGIGVFAGLVAAALPTLDGLERRASRSNLEGRVYARDGRTVLRRLRVDGSRTPVDEDDIPPALADAVIAAEDRRFLRHPGVDVRGIARAVSVDLRAGELREGGSTITQQFVKNAYIGSDRTVARKTREAVLATALETRWSKRRILAGYLGSAYFGNGAYGITDAARSYFGVPVRELDTAQSALLAGLLRAPERDNPFTAPYSARAERRRVLLSMYELDMLTLTEVRRAIATPLPRRVEFLARRSTKAELAPHFTDTVVARLVARYGTARALGGGLRVRTSIDAGMQRAALRAARQIDGTGLSVAIVAIDPGDGTVRALAVGGPAARASFDVASRGQRQPGSAFKPFALAAAFDAGLSADTRFASAPFSRRYPGGQRFVVTNASGLYGGETSLAAATHSSDNTVYARLQEEIGIRPVIATARAAGVSSSIDEVPAAVLGGLPEGVTPLELAHAYATFAAHGVRVGEGADTRPRMLLRVDEPGAGTTFRPGVVRRRGLARTTSDLVTQTLRGVVEAGTGTRAAIGRPAAGKTGTTEEYADAWFAGYTPELVTAVWVGIPEGAVPMRTQFEGGPVTGGTWPAQIWSAFMGDVLADVPARDFDLKLPSFVQVDIDPVTGLLAGPDCQRRETRSFLDGKQPVLESADCPRAPRPVPDVVGQQLEDAQAELEGEGFDAEIVERIIVDPDQDGIVVAQSPAAGEASTSDDPVLIEIGRSPIVDARADAAEGQVDGATGEANGLDR